MTGHHQCVVLDLRQICSVAKVIKTEEADPSPSLKMLRLWGIETIIGLK